MPLGVSLLVHVALLALWMGVPPGRDPQRSPAIVVQLHAPAKPALGPTARSGQSLRRGSSATEDRPRRGGIAVASRAVPFAAHPGLTSSATTARPDGTPPPAQEPALRSLTALAAVDGPTHTHGNRDGRGSDAAGGPADGTGSVGGTDPGAGAGPGSSPGTGWKPPRLADPSCLTERLYRRGYVTDRLRVEVTISDNGEVTALHLLDRPPDSGIAAVAAQAVRQCRWIAGADPSGRPATLKYVLAIHFYSP